MSTAPDYTQLLSAIDWYSLGRAVFLVGDVVLMLMLAVIGVDNILKLMGYDVMQSVRSGRDNARYQKRRRRESENSQYKKWKKDRGF